MNVLEEAFNKEMALVGAFSEHCEISWSPIDSSKKTPVSAAPLVEVYPDDPAVYHYTYSVDDDYTGAKIFADEERDGGDTHGMYEVSHHYNTI